jgi:hypothetical protein
MTVGVEDVSDTETPFPDMLEDFVRLPCRVDDHRLPGDRTCHEVSEYLVVSDRNLLDDGFHGFLTRSGGILE